MASAVEMIRRCAVHQQGADDPTATEYRGTELAETPERIAVSDTGRDDAHRDLQEQENTAGGTSSGTST